MALIGAYILAGELADGGDHLSAFSRYQQLMRAYVEAAPVVRPGVLRLANPSSQNGIRALHAGARLAAGPVGSAVAAVTRKGLVNIGADDVRLPTYRAGSTIRAGDRRVRRVISLGANTRNGGPQKPVPRLV